MRAERQPWFTSGPQKLSIFDPDHTPHTKRVGTKSELHTEVVYNRAHGWLQIAMSETTKGRTRTLSTSFRGEVLASFVEYVRDQGSVNLMAAAKEQNASANACVYAVGNHSWIVADEGEILRNHNGDIPVLLGPFDTEGEALEQLRAWQHNNSVRVETILSAFGETP